MSNAAAPTVPYQSTEDRSHLPEHLERIAQRDYCAVNEGYWVLRDAATALREHEAAMTALTDLDTWFKGAIAGCERRGEEDDADWLSKPARIVSAALRARREASSPETPGSK